MESYNFEFHFLDLSGLSNEEVQELLDYLKPGTLVAEVELPWNVSDSLATSKEVIGKDDEKSGHAKYFHSDQVAVSQTEVQPSLELLSVTTGVVVTETPQFSANAAVFIPASVTAIPPTNMGVPPFTGMPQNVQQFPPQFLSRPPFSTMSGTYTVPLDSLPSPSGLPVAGVELMTHHPQPLDSPVSRVLYLPANGSGPVDIGHDESTENRHKQSRHYSDRHSSRHKSTMKKKNHSHIEHSAVELSGSPLNVNIIDSAYRLGHVMPSEEAMMSINSAVVSASEIVSPEHLPPSVSNNGPPPNLMTMAHHPPFPVPMPHGSYQTGITYTHPHQIYYFPCYMQQPGSNSPVVTSIQPLVEGETIVPVVGNVTGPPPGMTGLYEGSPLTMSHSLPMHQTQTHHHSQHHHQQHQQQNYMAMNKEILIHPQDSYVVTSNSSQEVLGTVFNEVKPVTDSRANTKTEFAPDLAKDISTNESLKIADDNWTNSSICDDEKVSGASDPMSVQGAEVTPKNEDSVCVLSAADVSQEQNEALSVKNRTITPETNSLEDSGVDLGVDSPPLPAPPIPKISIEPSKRWADLFKNKNSSSSEIADNYTKPPTISATHNGHSSDDSLGFANDYELQKIGRLLHSYKPDFSPHPFQPRGLINKSNWCYINATLQALLVCAPFHNLIQTLQSLSVRTSGKSKTPIMSSLVKFISEFDNVSAPKKKKKDDLNIGHAFEPVCMHTMLSLIKSECIKGRQEDAEEFLSCILNGLHDEMVAIIKPVSLNENKGINGQASETNGHLETASEDDGDDQDWRMMGPKGKGSGTITRTSAHLSQSPVKAIFGGVTRSLLTSGSESSATLQPFFTLQLDIQADGVDSVEDALSHLIIKESIQGYTCSKTKKEIEASRRMTLEELPPVLILHFKRFVYDDKDGGSKKVLKKMDYQLDLELKKELLSSEVRQRYSAKYHRNYRLFAVVYHDGKEAVKGHYVADVYHAGINGWLHCDDRNIKPISETDVLTYNSPCVPYLLFYGRETMQNQASAK